MAKIVFRPVCSYCHIRLDVDINYEEYIYPEDKNAKYHIRSFVIDPPICPNCKQIFEAIEIPTRLPFINDF